MGQCGCGEMNIIAAYTVGDKGDVLAVDEYWGCADCNQPPGITLHFFSAQGWDEWKAWAPDAVVQNLKPLTADEVGSNGGYGEWFPFVGRDDLVKAAREGEEFEDLDREPLEAYEHVADWLSDNGLPLIREAMRRREPRK